MSGCTVYFNSYNSTLFPSLPLDKGKAEILLHLLHVHQRWECSVNVDNTNPKKSVFAVKMTIMFSMSCEVPHVSNDFLLLQVK